jgi:glycosyltransferase involved in cell wall biosynthesis
MLPDRAQTSLLIALSVPGRLIEKLQGSFRPKSLARDSASVFKNGDCFVTVGFNLGAEQFNVLCAIRQRIDLRVISCCHDLIPWVRPDLTLDRITRPFLRYLGELIQTSDHIVCNSACTARDLRHYLGTEPSPPSISVIRLGSRIGQTQVATPSINISSILDRPFILYVSTIERRKNHEILLDAYRGLLNQGITDLPVLLLVGMRGWGAERFFQKLDADPEVAEYAKLLHHVGDNDLALLYQKALFTVYPSLYEGWGLPVAESLAYGKLCIATNAASVPEVGGDLIQYCSPEDASAWGAAIFRFASDPGAIAAEEEKIRQGYRPPEWHETVAQIMKAVLPSGKEPR